MQVRNSFSCSLVYFLATYTYINKNPPQVALLIVLIIIIMVYLVAAIHTST